MFLFNFFAKYIIYTIVNDITYKKEPTHLELKLNKIKKKIEPCIKVIFSFSYGTI